MIRLLHGDMLVELPKLAADSFHAAVTDPPYHLASIVKRFGAEDASPAKGNDAYIRASKGFMGKQWDGGDIAFRAETWAHVYRVLKPGAFLLAFGGTRNSHRMVCAIEDAGFEIRDSLCWLYGSGFPKSHDVSKAIDRAAGAEREVVTQGAAVKRMIPGADQNESGWVKDNGRLFVPTETRAATNAAHQWSGWGTALKPAHEPICVARKPLSEKSVAANVLRHGSGGINVDACRVEAVAGDYSTGGVNAHEHSGWGMAPVRTEQHTLGRWPANVAHDGSTEVLAGFPDSNGQAGAIVGSEPSATGDNGIYGHFDRVGFQPRGDTGSAARFFYTAKADKSDRADSKHPTVKPVDLMRWLVTLVCPPGGQLLDPFAGSGTTGEACMLAGFDCTLIERDSQHAKDIEHRIKRWSGLDQPLFAEPRS